MEGAGQKMGNCTVKELLEDDYFENFLRHLLKEPLSMENIESVIHATSVKNNANFTACNVFY